MSDVIERAGQYYLRRFPGRSRIYICWQDGSKARKVSTHTSDDAQAKLRLAEFVIRKEHGRRTIDGAGKWNAILAEIMERQAAHARKRGLPFELDEPYVLGLMTASRFRCPVSGIPFTWSRDEVLSRGPWAPSIDRIDNRHGYIKGNVRVVALAANIAMNAWGYDVLLRLANGVVANHFHSVEAVSVVGAAGIEPTTPTMSTWCSTAELRAPTCQSLANSTHEAS